MLTFVPSANSDAVRKLRASLSADRDAVRIKVAVPSGARPRECYINVRNQIAKDGGRMQLGWAVWQHSDLFIEAEPHAVYDPSDGKPWVDVTPHDSSQSGKVWEILFIPNDNATYDYKSTDLPDNVRVPLRDDHRLLEALKLFSEKTALMNSVPGIDVYLPQDVARKVAKIGMRADTLLAEVSQPPIPGHGLSFDAGAESKREKIGRNDPCPCGSGKKFKKCCGSTA
jgi:SEC-C motif